ncbi:MAG: hypothetical protein VW450_07990 [Chloroflexota bacterium]
MAEQVHCHWHPDRETRLRCGNCGKPVCSACARQHPVGIRCKECARPERLPTYRVSRGYLVRGVAAAVGMGIAGAIGLRVIAMVLPFVGFFFFLIMAGLGYLMGEGVAAAVNRRRGRAYQLMALGAVVLAMSTELYFAVLHLSTGSLFTLMGFGMAAFVAWSRLQP